MKLDDNIIQAVKSYFLYGLRPGSFTEALIVGEIEEAALRAHPILKRDKLIKDHFQFVNRSLPPCCLGYENYKEWKGYYNYSEEDLTLIELSTDPVIIKLWIDLDKKNGRSY